MSIMDDLRWIADGLLSDIDGDKDAIFYSSEIRKVADRLAASGALVPVAIKDYDPNTGYDYYSTPTGIGWIGYAKNDREVVETPETYHEFEECQPVRLVPITEAEI